MEVAGQWRREWAGTAEYGKVTEGGVTRRVARAMEVLHASAPGARVRVMRAAYHSTAASGAPASSYMMHSSRQVISSGYNFLEPTSLPSKPLEISSTPLESLPDSEVEKENYKVTEPDDYDISEPSKWRGSSGKNSVRMPSEESSSTDNASIIDLDSRTSSRNTLRRSFQNKQSDDINRIHNINTRVSPLLDAPVALSTLKYTSLLNGSDDWNNRRKSYSFEDTSPINKNISSENKSFFMDSSTDSGICKSSEIVNDQFSTKYGNISEKMDYNQEETFTEWLSRNRTPSYKGMTPPKTIIIPERQINADKITVKSSGKVTITLPTEIYNEKQIEISKPDDYDRKTKKVEFCKTELHFAVDTGTVNIIATDDKPPPSNDFRRRRSAFVPLNEKIDKSITLFGEKNDLTETKTLENVALNSEFAEADENTAATKGILKNKIPKPKPYLLGENMAFGDFSDKTNDVGNNKYLANSSAVSLINQQLQSKRRHSDDTISSCVSNSSTFFNNSLGSTTKGPRGSSNHTQSKSDFKDPIKKQGFRNLKISPVSQAHASPKMRELRGSDLAYFGIDDSEKSKVSYDQDNVQEEIFHSVKLVQQVSNSVCNSEADSDPEYQNILSNHNLTITPTPKLRTKYGEEVRKVDESKILKPIIEQDTEKIDQSYIMQIHSKQSKESIKQTRLDNTISSKGAKEKSPKAKDVKNIIKHDFSSPGSKSSSLKRIKNDKENAKAKSSSSNLKSDKLVQEPPLYVNLQTKVEKKALIPPRQKINDPLRSINRNELKSCEKDKNILRSKEQSDKDDKYNKIKEHRSIARDKKNEISPYTKKEVPRRTEKLITPDHLQEKCYRQRSNEKNRLNTINSDSKYGTNYNDSLRKKKHRNVPKVDVNDINRLKKNEEQKKNLKENELNDVKITEVTDKITKSYSNANDVKTNAESLNSQYTIKSSMNRTVKTSNTSSKPDKLSKSKRSKYVINYDDKNGTVSSICKIKPGPGTYTRKLISIENKEPQGHTNDKNINKIALKK